MTLREVDLREPLRRALAARERRSLTDHGVPSAVLLPLFEEHGETRLWLLRRATSLRKHAGQVALPGGKRDPGDLTIVDTALREADEEIGMPRDAIDVLGCLDDLATHTGFAITPVVGWTPPGFTPRANAAEVARVFSVPLSLFDAPTVGEFPRHGHEHDGELVWGITLMIARSFLSVVRSLE